MNTIKYSRIKGQSLVFFVMISLAILGFIAVIVDGGNVYAMRRLSQNAADAGAMAGARELCLKGSAAGTWKTAAESYATSNNHIDLGNVISQTAIASKSGNNYVDVNVSVNYDPFFARIIGINNLTSVAHAQAGCFAPAGAEGQSVVPIAFQCPNIQEKTVDGVIYQYCDLQENKPPDTTCTLGEADNLIYIFFDFSGDKSSDQIWCTQWGPAPVGKFNIPINCDVNGDNKIDVYPISPLQTDHGWFWFNTNGGSCGSSEEVNIIENGLTYPIFPHHWYPGCPGDRGAPYNALAKTRINETVLLPVFTPKCTSAELQANDPKCKFHSGVDVVEDPSSSQDQFHLVSFAAFKVSCVDEGGNKCNNKAKDARAALIETNKKVSGLKLNDQKSIEGCFINDFVSGIIGDPGGVITGAWTIYLTK